MGSGFSKMKKQARMLQQQFSQMQEEMKNLIVVGSAGNGLVQVEMNGDKEVLKITIKPDCVDKDDVEGLQDLILAAFKDAEDKVKQQTSDSPLGGMPFGF
jgi:DNA-binding YbaB/EbfC family protein